MRKIFGIGLSRTGTKSLATALQILGYETLHYCPLINNGDAVSLDDIKKYDAIISTKFYGIYSTLDLQYPNSKFILTTRDIEHWFSSISKYSDRWNKGDLEKHEGEVKTYFENRDNLLCLDTGQKDAWSYLCNFLSRTVPQISFPHIK
jgi:hypothetical protein